MAINARLFGFAFEAAVKGTHLWGTAGKVKVALMTDGWTPNQDTDQKWSDVSAHEITGTNYTAGGKALTYPAPNYAYSAETAPGGKLLLKADSVVWSNLTTNVNIKYAILYTSNGAGLASPLLGYVTLSALISTDSEDFTLEWADDYVASVSLATDTPAYPFGRMMGLFWHKAFSGEFLFDNGNWKVALIKTAWSPNQDTDEFLSDVVPVAYAGNELANTGNYTRKALTNMEVLYSDVSDYGGEIYINADDVYWTALTSSADFYWALVFYDTGDASTSPIVGYVAIGASQSTTSRTVRISWLDGTVFQASLDTSVDK